MPQLKEKILKSIFPWLKLKDDLSLPKKIYVYFEIFAMVIVLSWLLTLTYLKVGYEKREIEQLAIYSFDKNQKEIKKYILEANKSLITHNIDITKLNRSLYFIDNSLVYYFTTLPSLMIGTSDLAYTLGKSIYFNYNLLTSPNNDIKLFTPKPIIVHEITHLWQNQHFNTYFIPRWVQEGYAVYVSGVLQGLKVKRFFNDVKPLQIPKKKRTLEGYILWGLMVKHAIEDLGYSVDDLHKGKVDYDTILHSLLKKGLD